MFNYALVRMVVVLSYLVGNGSALDMLARFQCLMRIVVILICWIGKGLNTLVIMVWF